MHETALSPALNELLWFHAALISQVPALTTVLDDSRLLHSGTAFFKGPRTCCAVLLNDFTFVLVLLFSRQMAERAGSGNDARTPPRHSYAPLLRRMCPCTFG
jgi:hypothetical protein